MKDLVFVSAQPDLPYFHWQIKIYVNNFIEKGIKPNQIHILFIILFLEISISTEPIPS